MRKRKKRLPAWLSIPGRVGRFLVETHIFTIFLGLFVLGLVVGFSTRPDPRAIPFAELFDQMRVVSYRESPSDTSARFVVELAAGGRVFSQYDVDERRFLPPPRGRAYSRTITGSTYEPLRVRGHVGYGFWLDIPASAGRPLLPEEFKELYQSTLDLVKPFSLLTNVLGLVSGYSIGHRIATWQTSLWSRGVQERVLATPDLGRLITREAWRRVLLEPVVMGDENDASRFAAVRGGHRLYASFFRVALRDSNAFIPREAERLAGLGRRAEAHAMLAFTEAVQRASRDSVHLTGADFMAIERWGSLLDRRGHWAEGTIPPAGEERMGYLGMLAWYGLAPLSPEVDRVWVGPRMLVRVGETEGFVTDEIPATGVGCPISWRERLAEANTSAAATASAWFTDRPEFPALIVFGGRIAGAAGGTVKHFATRLAQLTRRQPSATRTADSRVAPRRTAVPAVTGPAPRVDLVPGSGSATSAAPGGVPAAAGALDIEAVTGGTPGAGNGAGNARGLVSAGGDSAARRSVAYPARTMGTYANIILVTADSASSAAQARAAHAVLAFADSLMSNWTATSEVARINREGGSGGTPIHPEVARVLQASLETWRDTDGAFDITVEPLVRAWGFLGGRPRVPAQAELDSAFTRVGARWLTFDPAARALRFGREGMKIDLGGIAKGYAAQAAAARLAELGVRDALVDVSGNMAALGRPAHAGPWRIGIRDPHDRMPFFARLAFLPGEAVSTSGEYEPFAAADGRTYGHIMDPRSGRPADGLIAVTVLAPNAMLADAWSTALFVLGPAEAKRKARARADLSVVLIEPGAGGVDTVWVESSLRERFELEAQAGGRFRVEYF